MVVRSLVLGLRLVGAFVALLVAFVIGSALIGSGGMTLAPEEASQAGAALLLVSALNSLVLSLFILRSRWHGIKLILAVFVVYFGVETFMTQIETLYFNSAIRMSNLVLLSVVASGFVRAAIFAPLGVLILGKRRASPSAESGRVFVPPDWVKRAAILAVAYAIVYFLFGYFVAWQWAEVRQYYTGTTAILPPWTHYYNTLVSDPGLPLFQLLRGLMWAGLALLVVQSTRGRIWQVALVTALCFGVILASGVIFPNPYMPAIVRQGHFFELLSSMVTFGAFAAWIWMRQLASAPAPLVKKPEPI